MRRGRGDRRRLGARLGVRGGLKLTSMMDILTVLLLFLLKSFVVDGEAQVPPPGIDLPVSTAATSPAASLVIAIGDDAILVNSEKVATLAEVKAGRGMLIPALDTRLGTLRAQMDEIERAGGAPPPRVVTVQGDRQVEFEVLERVMFTLQQNGFEHIALAVLKSA